LPLVSEDYEWKEVGEERGGAIKDIKENLLAVDPETGCYTRMVIFGPGCRFDKVMEHALGGFKVHSAACCRTAGQIPKMYGSINK